MELEKPVSNSGPRLVSDGREDTQTVHDRRGLTDLGNAERLVQRHGEDIRYCHTSRSWFVWTGKRWTPDRSGEIFRRAKETVRSIHVEATKSQDADRRKELIAHATSCESRGRMRAMISLAQTEEGVVVSPEEFDTDPWLMNLENGTVDLKAGEFREHRQTDMITKLAPVEYDPAATCPTWDKFIESITGEDRELARYIQKAIGYSLTGDTSEQCLFFLYGSGRNGKSTFIETIRRVLGDCALQADFSTIIRGRHGTVRNDIARLAGARFVSAVECDQGQSFSEVMVKQLTGGDVVTARHLRQNFFEFRPAFKLWLAGNHKPSIKGTDIGIWRRIRLIPFTQTIADEDVDRNLRDKLEQELPGILKWAIEGCRLWLDEGVDPPASVIAATNQYREEMDHVGQFLEERGTLGSDCRVSVADLYRAYVTWTEDSGETALTRRALSRDLKERGFSNHKSTGGRFFWLGIGLRRADEVE